MNKKTQAIANQLAVQSTVNSIMDLAMVNRGVVYFVIRYSSHIEGLHITVSPVAAEVEMAEPRVVLEEYVDLAGEEALCELLLVEDKLIELIAEIKASQGVEVKS